MQNTKEQVRELIDSYNGLAGSISIVEKVNLDEGIKAVKTMLDEQLKGLHKAVDQLAKPFRDNGELEA